ncbi:unnamed protein product [Caenorhabditis auriculariae]|uniref:Uncharacterized protein n=1 Tax=Caenorhabditis auriculariae TaxID=2777116 RepID=A0A8S1HBA9_9PELO|nr:unnamed protein product [Caenorhabditis auriculariae]
MIRSYQGRGFSRYQFPAAFPVPSTSIPFFPPVQMILRLLLPILAVASASDAPQGLYETTGFHCIYRNSMKLPRHLHGQPQTSEPPFELTISDYSGKKVSSYEPGKNYTVKLMGFVHFRGFMLQPRLTTPEGVLIGSLRGGKFLNDDEQFAVAGASLQRCDRSSSNDALTHWSDEKKFSVEVLWSTDRDVGNVQFMATVASENEVFWERWRPRSAFLRSPQLLNIEPKPSLFIYSLQKEAVIPFVKEVTPDMHPLFEGPKNNQRQEGEEVPTEDDVFAVSVNPFEDDGSGSEADFFNANVFDTQKTDVITSDITSKPFETKEPHTPQIEAQLTPSRVFKKFQPPRNSNLGTDDLKFLNSHAQVQHDFVDNDVDSSEEKKCAGENFCANGGKCVVRDGKQTCDCPEGYIGDRCKQRDTCLHNLCANNATCVSGTRTAFGYSCVCQNGTVGTFCQFECPPDQCANGGTCIMKSNGEIGCKCQSGTTGLKCEREINECGWKKCLNGASCIDLFNDYKCVCSVGWMGRHCERPCRDAFGTCRIWKRDGECETAREQTAFFELNCAASCGICTPSNETEVAYLPLQPILMPFSWILGEWKTHVKGFNNKSTDYPLDMVGMGYNETLTFSVAKSLMFGTPHINYSSVVTSEEDPNNVHQYNGFLTIQQYKPEGQVHDRAALMTVSNTGLILVEEGDLVETSPDDVTLTLNPQYLFQKENSGAPVAKKLRRWFARKGIRLMQYIVREGENAAKRQVRPSLAETSKSRQMRSVKRGRKRGNLHPTVDQLAVGVRLSDQPLGLSPIGSTQPRFLPTFRRHAKFATTFFLGSRGQKMAICQPPLARRQSAAVINFGGSTFGGSRPVQSNLSDTSFRLSLTVLSAEI